MIRTIFIAGPTAVGKTEYSIRLARDLDAEIVSADSMQIYRCMDIGSAKPTPQERAAATHWLVDEIDPRTSFNVSDYQKLALGYIRDISGRGKLPVVSGGTGLYFNSLIYDMDFSAPQGDDLFRKKIEAEEDGDPIRLHERLRALDPKAAEAIHPNNVKRVLRAIERLEKGEEQLAAFSELDRPSPYLQPVLLGLTRERGELYDRIDRRVDKLFEAGLVGEVKTLMSMGFTSDDVAMKGIGYKEIIDALRSGRDESEALEEAKTRIKSNTRHYAKRQLTWFRRYADMQWIELRGDAFDEEAYGRLLEYAETAGR